MKKKCCCYSMLLDSRSDDTEMMSFHLSKSIPPDLKNTVYFLTYLIFSHLVYEISNN